MSVVGALTELHDHGTSHVDIRLENICFDNDNKAILSDFDRCEPVNEPVCAKVGQPSLMYPFHANWVYRQWDYVQLGILIARILCPADSSAEYHTVELALTHSFLETLYREGENTIVHVHISP